MQFLIIGHDSKDEKALERRLAARDAHIKLGDELVRSGNMWYGAAIWDDNNNMIGSMLVMDFPSEKDLQKWLDREPYVTGKVWQEVEVQRCNVRDPWQFNRSEAWYEQRKTD